MISWDFYDFRVLAAAPTVGETGDRCEVEGAQDRHLRDFFGTLAEGLKAYA